VSKRVFDIAVSTALILVLSPLLGIIAALVRMTSPGPAIHRASRVGRNGHTFTLYKFRSMVMGADQAGPGITARSDARVTTLGRLLRRAKLDELPQLFNVLRGEMSLVGPRPEDPRYVALYTPEQLEILSVRPGITSPASLQFRHEQDLLTGDDCEQEYVNKILPAKLEIDLEYVRNASLGRDIRILLQTLALLWR
jgi:lipopolysaccharide/colanic/teichoic acid biosynthesis glycosyltransferase